jgi:creatinine amidohydrolase
MTKKTAYNQLTWPEAKDVIAEERVVLLPTGSIEGHGPHCPLDTDTVIAEGVCKRIAEQIPDQVIVLPPLSIGLANNHMDFPGTLTLTEPTYINMVYELCMGIAHHGFKRILIINGHGGNQPALDVAARMVNNRFPEVMCGLMTYYSTPKAMKIDAEYAKAQGLTGSQDHGGFGETSCYLAFNPGPVNMDKAQRADIPYGSAFGFGAEDAPVILMPYWSTVTPLGMLGDPRKANAEDGNRYLDVVVEEIVQIIKDFKKMSLQPRKDQHSPPAPAWGTHFFAK